MPEIKEITVVLMLAILVEMFVEYFGKPILDTLATWLPGIHDFPFARYIAALIAILLTLYYSLDVLAMLLPWFIPSPIGMILTGLLIARGSNYVHDWIANGGITVHSA
jgi:hypothetical protein